MAKNVVVNPCLNNFVFDIMYRASIEDKKELPQKYKAAAKSSRSAQAFIRKSSQQEKQELLTLLGVQWLLVFFDRGTPQKKMLKEVFEKYRDPTNTQQSMIANAVKDRIYVMSDAAFFHDLGMMAKIENINTYKQSLLLNKAGYHVQRWRKDLREPETSQAEKNADAADYLALTGRHYTKAFEYCKELFGVIQTDFKVLHYLYSLRHKFVKYEELLVEFTEMKKFKMTSCIHRLLNNQMIQKKLKDKEYCVTAIGVKKIIEICQHVLKANEINKP